eukprot:Gregarina_sp_Poly_1__174@NODE_103_length_14370_cov_80_074250_g90_i0_p1_GENE_NODE_103_length_14370_cov_80_074250_g90_i0NODE_103_length_14370_cov_80_074250_g90_i0_p1_ORF_typecomplete_len2198_score329_07Bblock_TFIIIC/PF04182_12/3_3e20Bblock_TFIIIC/PF04182_12/6_8e03Bblock_TFIIIC/PF04182_12/8_2HTH_20/PF12840_7/0_0026HTH_20/PF12840_7/7_7e02MarR/PF01047_22/1_3MarR/PF01047_22/1_1e02SurE/PF01975_17/0_4_NODE_103_length_14370_cov_80_074250_g90_i0364110234
MVRNREGAFLFRDALEELCYDGFEGATIDELISQLCVRDPRKVNEYRSLCFRNQCFEALKTYPGVSVSDDATPGAKRRKLENGAPHSCPDELSRQRLRASEELMYSNLNLWAYPDVLENPVRLRILLAITRQRYEGYWQFALAKDLDLDPKTVFQHLKPLYRYHLIVRLSLVMPQASGEQKIGQLSASGVIWLERFFDLSRVPKRFIHVYLTQQVAPFRTSVVRLLSQQPDHILLEKEFRSYFLSFFLSVETHDNLVCSTKTICRFYLRMRKELLHQGVIRRVRAWCPQTAKIELCIMLASPPQNALPDKPDAEDTTISADRNPTTFRVINHLSADDDDEEADDIDKAFQYIQRPTIAEVVDEDPGDDENEALNDNRCVLTGISIPKQVLAVLEHVGSEGIVTPSLAQILQTTTKRLSKILNVMETGRLLGKRAQRQGKYFMYRYFLSDKLVNSMAMDLNMVPLGAKVGDGRAAARKTLTEQFVTRLQIFKDFVSTAGVCMVPDVSKRFSAAEGTPNGPDRKTILRVASAALEQKTTLKQGRIAIGSKKSQELLFFYDTGRFPDENDAAQIILKSLSEKRSEACKEAIKKNQEVSLQIGDGSVLGAAVEDINRKIERWEMSSNPIQKYNPQQSMILPDVVVESRLEEIVPVTNRQTTFSQRLLAHYGFLFPVMIRLKLFHLHLLKLYRSRLDAVEQPAVNGDDNHTRDELAQKTATIFSLREAVDEMSIESFLRLVGHGYRNQFIEGYLHGATPRCPDFKVSLEKKGLKMHELPLEIYESLLTSPKTSRSGRPPFASGRSAFVAVHRLCHKLRILGLLEPAQPGDQEGGSTEETLWRIKTTATVYSLVAERESPSLLGTFTMAETAGVDAFWRCLRGAVEDWSRISLLKKDGATDVHSFGHCPKNLPLPEAFSKKNWKGQLLLSAETRAELDSLARKIVARAETAECHGEGNQSALCVLNPQSPDVVRYAASLSLSPDDIMRYLMRFFSTAGNSRLYKIAQGKIGNVALHASRDLRYSCHLCKMMYAQRPSMVAHYANIHNTPVPADERLYTLPAELERRKRRLRSSTQRRKRRRKPFGSDERTHTENVEFLGDRRRRHQKHVAQLLSCVSSDAPAVNLEDDDIDLRTGGGRFQRSDIYECSNNGGELRRQPQRDWRVSFREPWRSALTDNEVLLISELAVMSSDEEQETDIETRNTRRTSMSPQDTVSLEERASFDFLPPSTELGRKETAWQQRFCQLSPQAQEVLKTYRLSRKQRLQVKTFLQEARRDDEYMLIGFLVVMERLRWCFNQTIHCEVRSMYTDGLPLLTDPLWDLFSLLKPAHPMPPAAVYFTAQYCLHRNFGGLNLRLFSTYRRLCGRDLHECLTNFALPLRSNIRDVHLWEFPALSSNFNLGNSKVEKVRVVVGRAITKMVLLTQPSRYRVWWASSSMRCLSESELQSIWSFWNKCGMAVLLKRSILLPENQKLLASPQRFVYYWECISKRRFSLSRGYQSLMFGRFRQWTNLFRRRRELLCLEALNPLLLEGPFPLKFRGLQSTAAAAAIEALAKGAVSIAVSWSDSKTHQWRPDTWEGFPCHELAGSDDEHEAFAGAIMAGCTKNSDTCTIESDSEPWMDMVPEEGLEDDDESADEDYGGEGDLGYGDSRRGLATGVQEHISNLAPDVPDIQRFWWKSVAEGDTVCIRGDNTTKLIYEEVELSCSLCGQEMETETSIIDPWLLPCKLDDGSVLGDAQKHESALEQDRRLEFLEDVANDWTLRDRNMRFETVTQPPTAKSRRPRGSSAALFRVSMAGSASPNHDKHTDFWEGIEAAVVHRSGEQSRLRADSFFDGMLKLCVSSETSLLRKRLRSPEQMMILVSALIWLHARAFTAPAGGIYRVDLQKAFCAEMETRYKSHESLHEDFVLSLSLLNALRALVVVPGGADWLLLVPSKCYSLRVRQLRKHADLEQVQEKVLDAQKVLKNRPSPATFAALQRLSVDDVSRPPFVPLALWERYGPQVGCAFVDFALPVNPLDDPMNASGANHESLSQNDLKAVHDFCRWDLGRLQTLAQLQQQFANLRFALVRNGNVPSEDRALFETTEFLGVSEVGPSTWRRLDGRLNVSLLALTTARVSQLLMEFPGSTLWNLQEHIKFVDICELRELCDCMVAEGLIVHHEAPILCGERTRIVPKSGVSLPMVTELKLAAGNACSNSIHCYSLKL